MLGSAAPVPVAIRGARLRRAAATSGRRSFRPATRGRRIRIPVYIPTENAPSRPLRQDLANRSALDVGQALFAATEFISQPLVVDSQRFQDSGM